MAQPFTSSARNVAVPSIEPPRILVIRRGWHIDVGFAAAELHPSLGFATADLPNATYVFFGFGDRRYLESRTHGVSSLAAALWPGRGIVLVTGIDATPQDAFGARHVVSLTVSAGQLEALQEFIRRSLVAATAYDLGPYPGSEYFLAVPRYSAIHTCNTWAAEALWAAGLPVHTGGVMFAGQVWSQVRRLGRVDMSGRLDVSGQIDVSGRVDVSQRVDVSGQVDFSGHIDSPAPTASEPPALGMR